jgi:RNA polymerase sigma-70 factor (ECF subfamily)
MLSSTTESQRAVRREADLLELAAERGRFRRRAAQRPPAGDRLVTDAIAQAQGGDPEALRFLYLRYADSVYGYVCSILRDEHDAEDVTQQVFAKLLTALGRYEPRNVPFSAWILRVAHNTALDHLRARRTVPCEELDRGAAGDGGRERFAELRVALADLPPEQRDVLVLRFLIGLTPGEIAERMGRSVEAVHGLQHRGRRGLRRAMAA